MPPKTLTGDEKKAIALAIFLSVVFLSIGYAQGNITFAQKKEMGGHGSGEKEKPQQEITLGVQLGMLDDTYQGNNTWTTLISSVDDYAVVWVNNTGNVTDTYTISISEVPDGWSVSQDKMAVTVNPEDEMGWVILRFSVPPGAKNGAVVVTAESQTDPSVRDNITINCNVEGTDAQVSYVGDTIMVSYTVTDENGTQLDSGTLPVTAGEPEVGYGNQLAYIDGFYLGVLGMRKPDVSHSGETKNIVVPPELAYGEDMGTLYFTLTVESDLPG